MSNSNSLQDLRRGTASDDASEMATAFLALRRLIVMEPRPHLQSTFELFFQYLDYSKIPSSLLSLRGTPSAQMDIERALQSMRGLEIIGMLHAEDPNVIQSLVQYWHDIWAWIQYLHTSCIDDERSSYEKRGSILATVFGMHKLFSSQDTLRAVASSTDGYLEMITQQWTMQIRVPRLIPNPHMYPPASVLATYTNQTLHNASRNANRIIMALTGNPDDVARLTLDHLGVTVERFKENLIFALNTGADIDLMVNLRSSIPVRNALLARHAVRAVTGVLVSLSIAPYSKDTREAVIFCIASCANYLGFALDSANGLRWVIEALEAQLLPAIFQCEQWLSHMSPAVLDQFSLMLSATIPKYLLYSSVVTVAARSFRRVCNLETSVGSGGHLRDAWSSFKVLLEERVSLQVNTEDINERSLVCSNAQCRKIDNRDTFFMCNGCNEVWFCSEACKSATRSMHTMNCFKTQMWYREGRLTPLGLRDFQYAKRVAQGELSKRYQDIQWRWKSNRPRVPVVEFDFRSYPYNLTLGSSTSSQPATYDKDAHVYASWNALVARAEQESSGILRIYMPIGEFHEVEQVLFSLR